MAASVSAASVPAKSRSSSGSFDGGSIVFNDVEDGALNVSGSSNGGGSGGGNGGRMVRGLVLKAVCLVGGAFLLRKLTKSTTRWDHSRVVAQSLSGEKFSTEQAARDPMTYFNLRLLTCPATVLADGARVLYFEQAFWRTPERPYRQRFYVVKPCPKEMKCDVEVGSYAVRDVEEYRNFCDRPKNQRPQPEEVVGDMAEHLTTVYLSACDRGRRCLFEGSTPPGGFPNSWSPLYLVHHMGVATSEFIAEWSQEENREELLTLNSGTGRELDFGTEHVISFNGATRCTSELTIYRNGEVHCWDRAYDDDGNQVWGVRQGPYEFKPETSSSSNGTPLQDLSSTFSTRKIDDTASATLSNV